MTIAALRDLIPNFSTLLYIGVRVIFIAIAFEFIAWYAGRRLAALTDSFSQLDKHRDAKWRNARRLTLKRVPRFVARFLIYTIAGMLVLSVFGVPLLPLALAFGGVAVMVGAALMPTLRDYSQGYFLLAEDSLAPGDMVSVNGHVGEIEKISLRAVWMRDDAGCIHVLSHRDIHDVTILKKSSGVTEGEAETRENYDKPVIRDGVAFDPLNQEHVAKRPPKARPSAP